MMKKTEIFRGRIAACSRVEQFTKHNGTVGVKCVFHLVSADGCERAITATGDLTNWAGCLNAEVEVEYVNRVFEMTHKNMDWYGNDVYATAIKML